MSDDGEEHVRYQPWPRNTPCTNVPAGPPKWEQVIIFELKRSSAGDDALIQALRYAQHAGQWTYAQIQERQRQYTGRQDTLNRAHQEAFSLAEPLGTKEFNHRQQLLIIGSAADESLVNSVDYWRRQGLSIDFLPYRVYELADQPYFEFFALPYDLHQNPADTKGVLFDTNRSYDETSIWYMMENKCIAAFGDAKRFVDYIYPGDTVFFSHVGTGIVAAAKVGNGAVRSPEPETRCRGVSFVTPPPARGDDYRAMPFKKMSEITGKSFFWARTIKVPYLGAGEAARLVEKLQRHLQAD